MRSHPHTLGRHQESLQVASRWSEENRLTLPSPSFISLSLHSPPQCTNPWHSPLSVESSISASQELLSVLFLASEESQSSPEEGWTPGLLGSCLPVFFSLWKVGCSPVWLAGCPYTRYHRNRCITRRRGILGRNPMERPSPGTVGRKVWAVLKQPQIVFGLVHPTATMG